MNAPLRHTAASLRTFAADLLGAAGLEMVKAAQVAEILVEGDLLGHSTHGLQLLAPYLGELESGKMARDGVPEVLSARPAVQLWDGRRLPGPWLVLRAIEVATDMARSQGTGTISIRHSHHIACLAAYLPRATERGLMILVTCSDPAACSVAPFGAVSPVFTPNPIAAGIPTAGDPILLDISASLTTNGLTNRLHKEGRRLPHPWAQDAQGNATDDPGVLFANPKGTLLPTGGLDAGQKGYALALLIEALTGGLAGFGRADPHEGWGATVMVQIVDPEAFGGLDAFRRQTGWVAQACHDATPRPGGAPVRLPGERGLALQREQARIGIALYPGILDTLRPFAGKYGVPMPGPA